MKQKILVLVGGGIKHAQPFLDAGKVLGVDVTLSSFSKVEYKTEGGQTVVTVDGVDLASFDAVYFRLVGKRYEDAALTTAYCRAKDVRIIDRVYQSDGIIRIPLPKSLEAKMLYDAGLPLPKTYFGRLKAMREVCPKLLGFPFVIKGTMGKQGHAVWSPKTTKELDDLVTEFTPKEKVGERFIAQEFIKASQRNRIFVIGERAISGITRPTRWRKRFLKAVNGQYPGIKAKLTPMPSEDADIAVKASKALGIEVGGVDIITEDITGKKYVLEVNSAPRWASLKHDTGINIEEEIIKYISNLD